MPEVVDSNEAGDIVTARALEVPREVVADMDCCNVGD